jgi:NAD(P)-dependent dehydrogenase (short-subunit alcohol dehydrogenase family)
VLGRFVGGTFIFVGAAARSCRPEAKENSAKFTGRFGEKENEMGMVDGKVAIVTGATSGIGTRTVEVLIEEGARVVFTGRRAEEGQTIAYRLGPNAVFVQADATSESDWRRVGETTMERFGRIDCLFNNAGGPAPTGSITSVSVEGFDDAMALLVRSVMLGMKHTAPVMMAQRTGSIINNASVAAHLAGYSSSMIYGAAKAAVLHLTRCAAMELGEHNVRVNSVSPGAIATGILLKALGLDARAADSRAESMKEGFAKAQPIPRAGVPDDIAQCVVWLASDRASFINGTDIIVDGGMIGGRMYTPHQESLKQMRTALQVPTQS